MWLDLTVLPQNRRGASVLRSAVLLLRSLFADVPEPASMEPPVAGLQPRVDDTNHPWLLR